MNVVEAAERLHRTVLDRKLNRAVRMPELEVARQD
eukprot:COSAG02_NODE_4583_length_5190_cov_4.804753_3_plen_35_part_00